MFFSEISACREKSFRSCTAAEDSHVDIDFELIPTGICGHLDLRVATPGSRNLFLSFPVRPLPS